MEYQPTKTMVADGLTKALTGDNHQKFVAMLNLDAIESLITARAEAEEAAAEKDASEQASGGEKGVAQMATLGQKGATWLSPRANHQKSPNKDDIPGISGSGNNLSFAGKGWAGRAWRPGSSP